MFGVCVSSGHSPCSSLYSGLHCDLPGLREGVFEVNCLLVSWLTLFWDPGPGTHPSRATPCPMCTRGHEKGWWPHLSDATLWKPLEQNLVGFEHLIQILSSLRVLEEEKQWEGNLLFWFFCLHLVTANTYMINYWETIRTYWPALDWIWEICVKSRAQTSGSLAWGSSQMVSLLPHSQLVVLSLLCWTLVLPFWSLSSHVSKFFSSWFLTHVYVSFLLILKYVNILILLKTQVKQLHLQATQLYLGGQYVGLSRQRSLKILWESCWSQSSGITRTCVLVAKMRDCLQCALLQEEQRTGRQKDIGKTMAMTQVALDSSSSFRQWLNLYQSLVSVWNENNFSNISFLGGFKWNNIH